MDHMTVLFLLFCRRRLGIVKSVMKDIKKLVVLLPNIGYREISSVGAWEAYIC